jgi:ribosomal protein S18 acetylase RimI-like enzyme
MSQVDSPTALQFRRAQPEDVTAIVALVESAYRGESSKQGWTTEAALLAGQRTDRDEVAELISGERSRIVLAERDGELVGSVMLAQLERDSVDVGMLAVRPNLQIAGVGRALLDEVERIVRAERLGERLRMTVIGQRSELIAWYERRGYRVTGETKPFPYGQPRFGLPRRPDLYFQVLEKPLAELS